MFCRPGSSAAEAWMARWAKHGDRRRGSDRKSTRLNSSHRCISYAVLCSKKKDTRWEASIQLGGDGAESSFNFHAARDLDTNPWTGNWIILWSDATSHNAETSKASTLTDSAGFTDTTPTLFHTYVMNREGTTGVRYFQDAAQRALLTTNVPTVSLRPYAFADAGTGATMWQKYDWWKVRQYVTPEPTSAIAAEEGVGPAYQAAGTIQSNTSTTLSVPW